MKMARYGINHRRNKPHAYHTRSVNLTVEVLLINYNILLFFRPLKYLLVL